MVPVFRALHLRLLSNDIIHMTGLGLCLGGSVGILGTSWGIWGRAWNDIAPPPLLKDLYQKPGRGKIRVVLGKSWASLGALGTVFRTLYRPAATKQEFAETLIVPNGGAALFFKT